MIRGLYNAGAKFQSTPVIANGRIELFKDPITDSGTFQSTPVIANGRISLSRVMRGAFLAFQSTPVIANGRIPSGLRAGRRGKPVSIHARYC